MDCKVKFLGPMILRFFYKHLRQVKDLRTRCPALYRSSEEMKECRVYKSLLKKNWIRSQRGVKERMKEKNLPWDRRSAIQKEEKSPRGMIILLARKKGKKGSQGETSSL